jgi:hypothetical protein
MLVTEGGRPEDELKPPRKQCRARGNEGRHEKDNQPRCEAVSKGDQLTVGCWPVRRGKRREVRTGFRARPVFQGAEPERREHGQNLWKQRNRRGLEGSGVPNDPAARLAFVALPICWPSSQERPPEQGVPAASEFQRDSSPSKERPDRVTAPNRRQWGSH